MFTSFDRDALFAGAWFGLMAMVWLGWAQEAPPRGWRGWLAVGSLVGVLIASCLGIVVARNWDLPTALVNRYQWFGLLVIVEVLFAGGGCLILARRRARLMAWWVALVVAVHFIPMGWLFDDWGYVALGVVLVGALATIALSGRLRDHAAFSSTVVGPVMGGSFLACSIIFGGLALIRVNSV